MKTLKLIALAAFALLFSQCKIAAPTAPSTSGTSVVEVLRTLDTVRGKFYALAMVNLRSSPGQVLQRTADWAKTQPNVKNVFFFDSTYLNIELNSGLRTTFAINLYGNDGLSLSRGGGTPQSSGHLTPSGNATNAITNKNVLIFAPFVGTAPGDLYHDGDLDHLVSSIKSAGTDFKVTLLLADQCRIDAVESFGQYGLVLISTHGLPDGFITGHITHALATEFDTSDVEIKANLDNPGNLGPGGYDKVLSGYFDFAVLENINNKQGWQAFLKHKVSGGDIDYRIIVNSKFINSLPPMPNTIILGNMCYSGWNNVGTFQLGQSGEVHVEEPIKTAFTNKQLISYYSYGFSDGTSRPVDNNFAKRMEDSLVHSLVVVGDSTGNAYLNSSSQEFTASQLKLPMAPFNPDMPFKHSGADNYSYASCIKEFTDERDGQKYKAVCIGKQTWMAENLRYNAPGSTSYYYGRLYDSTTVMSGVCPNGWHAPSNAEWQQLFDLFGGIDKAGGALKSTSGDWDVPNVGATNVSGFNGLPGGYKTAPGPFAFLYAEGIFCSTSLDANGAPLMMLLDHNYVQAFIQARTAGSQASCRCLKD